MRHRLVLLIAPWAVPPRQAERLQAQAQVIDVRQPPRGFLCGVGKKHPARRSREVRILAVCRGEEEEEENVDTRESKSSASAVGHEQEMGRGREGAGWLPH